MIYTSTKSPKKFNKSKTKKEMAEYNAWLKEINSIKTTLPGLKSL
jgi:exopolysaccharide biosynthesis predicted pyruvyltransferase EpsI